MCGGIRGELQRLRSDGFDPKKFLPDILATMARCCGTFLENPTAVPDTVRHRFTSQLGIADTVCLLACRERAQRWRHRQGVRRGPAAGMVTDHGKPTIEVRKYRARRRDPRATLKGSLAEYTEPAEPVAAGDWLATLGSITGVAFVHADPDVAVQSVGLPRTPRRMTLDELSAAIAELMKQAKAAGTGVELRRLRMPA